MVVFCFLLVVSCRVLVAACHGVFALAGRHCTPRATSHSILSPSQDILYVSSIDGSSHDEVKHLLKLSNVGDGNGVGGFDDEMDFGAL